MRHALKVLTLALPAVLCLATAVAPGAYASGELFHFENEVTYVTGLQESEEGFENGLRFDYEGGPMIMCEGSFQGEVEGQTTESLVLSPKYTNCWAEGETLETEGCTNTFFGSLAATTEEEEHAPFEISCEGSSVMRATLVAGCVLAFGPQTAEELTHGITYTNVEGAAPSEDAVTMNITVHGIHWEVVSGEFSCTLFGFPQATGTDATYLDKILLKGYADEAYAEPSGIRWE